jgi:hypothetical protein
MSQSPLNKHKLIAALVAALVGVPALVAPFVSTASGATGPPPTMHLAVLPRPARVRIRRRQAAMRAIRAALLRRLHDRNKRSRPRGLSIQLRLPVRESLARGPPLKQP